LKTVLVVEKPERWPIGLPGTEIVSGWDYLTGKQYADTRRMAVFNACRFYGYQRLGYYVSLLAAARGHRVMPSVETLQAFGVAPLARITSEDLDDMIQRYLAPLKSQEFELSIYFGRNVARRYDKLSKALFQLFPAPFLRAHFIHDDDHWRLQSIRPMAGPDVPEAHHQFAIEQATTFFERGHRLPRRPQPARYELAILWDPEAEDKASDEGAIRRFVRAARKVGLEATIIDSDDYPHIGEYDALFIRDTTNVNHYTYRFAQRAAAVGLVVIDDPQSIIRCTNKVYQAELFDCYDIPHPRTLIVHQENVDQVEKAVGFPCVLKRPDASFSAGVVKVADRAALERQLETFFESSMLVVAQEYLPSEFDWRIGVIGGRALYACRYWMAPGHWQIIHRKDHGKHRYGRVETLPIEEAPPIAVQLAVRCAQRIGTSLYGIDIKEANGRFYVIEVNDNPSIDAGVEDHVLRDELYLAIMQVFRDRLDARGVSDDSQPATPSDHVPRSRPDHEGEHRE
jgi:glutathione synthase/RimK-type ligase-like ATP-grasp enzyme